MAASVGGLAALIRFIAMINDKVFWVCRQISWIAIGVMVLAILAQVFFRYVLNNALPWSEELARVLMLWLTGLMAPSAYRWGGFVAIDLLRDMLPRTIRVLFSLVLFGISLIVLIYLVQFGLKHINSGWLFASSTLKIKLAWFYMSLPVGFALMISACVELILKEIHELIDPDVNYGADEHTARLSAE